MPKILLYLSTVTFPTVFNLHRILRNKLTVLSPGFTACSFCQSNCIYLLAELQASEKKDNKLMFQD